MRRILFVDDEPQILRAMQRSLRRRSSDWEMVFANGAHAALAELTGGHFDVVVSDGRMPEMDGIALLKRVKAEHPTTIRIILSGHADDEAMIPALPAIHQFLSKPCEISVLEAVLESALEASRRGDTEAVREALLTSDWLPPGPKLYTQLTQALKNPDLPMARIYGLIERDASLTAVLLKTVNSAYFGLRRQVSSVIEAARLLGVVAVRCLALFVEAFAHLDADKRVDHEYVEWFHTHSFLTARIAQALAAGSALAPDRVFSAGLLHDMGELLIATRLPEEHMRARIAVSQGRATTVHQAEQIGRTHAEIGSWLLSHWGLPAFLVETASRHHGPVPAYGPILDLTQVIHVADCLAVELAPGREGPAHSVIEAQLIEAAGGPQRLEQWRELAALVAAHG